MCLQCSTICVEFNKTGFIIYDFYLIYYGFYKFQFFKQKLEK